MDPDVLTFFQVCAGIIMSVGSLAIIGVVTRFLWIRSGRRDEPRRVDDNRLQHLEQAVDAIAIEVERISEAQRFQTKLLSESTARAVGVKDDS